MYDQRVVCFLQKLKSLLNAYGSLSGGESIKALHPEGEGKQELPHF